MRMDYIPLLGRIDLQQCEPMETETPKVKRMDNIPLLGGIDSHHSVTG